MKYRLSKKQMSETYLLGAILAIIGGYLDAYTYISRGGVFANAQTGNIVFLGISLAYGNFLEAIFYLIPVIAFILGIIIAEYIRKISKSSRLHWRQYVIFIEFIILIFISFLPSNKNDAYICDMISNILISFVCSLQVQSFRKISGIVCATTMCTGNLRSGTECIWNYCVTREKKSLINGIKYYGIVFFFIIGVIISIFITNIYMEKSVLFCCLGLGATLILMFIRSEEQQT